MDDFDWKPVESCYLHKTENLLVTEDAVALGPKCEVDVEVNGGSWTVRSHREMSADDAAAKVRRAARLPEPE